MPRSDLEKGERPIDILRKMPLIDRKIVGILDYLPTGIVQKISVEVHGHLSAGTLLTGKLRS